MKVSGIDINQTTFMCWQGDKEKLREYGKVVQQTGFINGKKLDIYFAYSREGKLLHKLYYLSDAVGNWLKSKLKYYKDGKCYKIVRSEKG